MSKYYVDGADLTSVADAIREKAQTSGLMIFPDDFIQTVEDMSTGGGVSWEEPLETDFTGGYIDYANANRWVPQDNDDNLSTIYELTSGHAYMICLGATVSTRFRATVFATDVRGATQTITGKNYTSESNPAAYSGVYFINNNSTYNKFLVIQTSNDGTSDVITYLLDVTEAIDSPAEIDWEAELRKNDDKSRLYVYAHAGKPFLIKTVSNSTKNIQIDWGDGSTETTPSTGPANSRLTHTYAKSGYYLIVFSGGVYGSDASEGFDLRYPYNDADCLEPLIKGACFSRVSTTSSTIQDRTDLEVFIDYNVNTANPSYTLIPGRNGMLRTYWIGRTLVNGGLQNLRQLCDVRFSATQNYIQNLVAACSSLEQFPILLAATSVGTSCFNGCKMMKCPFDFPETVTSIAAYAFAQSGITALVLRAQSVVQLAATTAFESTKIADGTAYIYVPDALVEDYKTATNWSTYAAQIKPLSEYTGA